MSKYQFNENMKEISGFGGEYEAMCRKMLVAALEWLDANPEASPQYKGYKDVYGVLADDNADAKALSKAATSVTEGATGAMHQAVITHALFIRKNGWEKYVAEMTHPRGQVGILEDRIEDLSRSLESARKRRDEYETMLRLRNNVIAEKVLGWELHPVSQLNDQQKVYAPSAEAALSLKLGDSLYKFVDEAIQKMEH